jgi:hypothetical protein
VALTRPVVGLSRLGWLVPSCQPGRDLLGLGAADLGDIRIGAAVRLLNQHRGVLPAQPPDHLLPDVGEMPDTGVVVIAAGPLADHGERLTAAERAGREELHRDRDGRVLRHSSHPTPRWPSYRRRLRGGGSSRASRSAGQSSVIRPATQCRCRGLIGVFGVQDEPRQPAAEAVADPRRPRDAAVARLIVEALVAALAYRTTLDWSCGGCDSLRASTADVGGDR